jgi:hypothetical protein
MRIARAAMAAALITAATVPGVITSAPATAANGVPTPTHTVVVVMENHSYNDIIGSSSAPYITSLSKSGANFTRSFAVTHPSEPNYLALFSGSTQGITDDSCPHSFATANLGSELITAGKSFTGYSESMPSDGYTGCQSGQYYRKHNPWVNFTNVPSSSNLRFSDFPSNYSTLPSVSVVVPNICNDMHDCSVATGDTWLKNHIDSYVQWAKANNGLLILTFDEDDHSQNNQIPTIFIGQHVKTGNYSEQVNHYRVLRTIEDAYSLAYAGNSANYSPITDVWQ